MQLLAWCGFFFGGGGERRGVPLLGITTKVVIEVGWLFRKCKTSYKFSYDLTGRGERKRLQ